jgi:hypothetical protein
MKATPRAVTATVRKAGGRHFWRWPLAYALAVAMVVSLFHDLPALAGGDLGPVAVVAHTSTPFEEPDAQAPGLGCHCLCHITAQSTVSPLVTPIVFSDSLSPPRNAVPIRSWAGLPPFRPPRV